MAWRSALLLSAAGGWAGAAAQDSNTTYKPYWGNIVPGRDVPPPTGGCVTHDKVYEPLTPSGADIFTVEHGWDWCQYKCRTTYLTSADGQATPCAHFAYFPDGKCYLQDGAAKLQADQYCNDQHPCSYGYEVIAGPPTCDNTSLWEHPPTTPAPGAEAPTTEAPTEAPTEVPTTAAPTVPAVPALPAATEVRGALAIDVTDPQEFVADPAAAAATSAALARSFSITEQEVTTKLAIDAADPSMVHGTFLATVPAGAEAILPAMLEAANAGALTSALQDTLRDRAASLQKTYDVVKATASVQAQSASSREVAVTDVPEGSPCNGNGKTCASGLSCIGAAPDVDGICVAGLATTGEPTTPAPTTTETQTTTEATTTTATTTGEELTNATVVGYYYEPHEMQGTARAVMPSWRACMDLCFSNPFCEHFGYWPDGGCTQQGNNVTLVKAVCPEGETECPGLQVITGPRDLSAMALWPVIPTAAPATLAPTAAPTTEAPPKVVADKDVIVQAAGPEGGSNYYMLFGLVGGLALVLAGLGLFWYVQGQNESDEEDEDEDEDYEDEESGSPQKGME